MAVSLLARFSPIQLFVDARVTESHLWSARTTKTAVENAEVISDHVILDPPEITIDFDLNNLGLVGRITDAANILKQFLESNSAVILSTTSSIELTAMIDLIQARQRVDVVTQHYLYKSMVLVEIDSDNVSPFSGRLRGFLRFQQVKPPSDDAQSINNKDTAKRAAPSKSANTAGVPPSHSQTTTANGTFGG